jgi:hypothetical protein
LGPGRRPNDRKPTQGRNTASRFRESIPAHVDIKQIECPIRETDQSRSDSGKATQCATGGAQRRTFPYGEVAKLWHEGKTIPEIAQAIGRFEENKKDPCHSLRNFLRVMHQKGYADSSGQRVQLPYRVQQRIVDTTPVTPAQRSPSPGPKRLRPMPKASRELGSRYNREELFAKVWATPMQELAKEYGVSDVALAKACKRRGLPVPGRGYWAKKAAGKPVPERPPLPEG